MKITGTKALYGKHRDCVCAASLAYFMPIPLADSIENLAPTFPTYPFDASAQSTSPPSIKYFPSEKSAHARKSRNPSMVAPVAFCALHGSGTACPFARVAKKNLAAIQAQSLVCC
jgi:hypothetical protein